MPQSLTLNTPSQGAIKRQRSQELPLKDSRPALSGQALFDAQDGRLDDSARHVNVKIPSYLNKPKAKISLAFQELEWKQRFRLQHGFQNPHTSPFWVDRSKVVFSRNRYGNVQPWDASRVRLRNPIGGSDYVNASPITLRTRLKKSQSGTSTPAPSSQSSSPSSFQAESRYIATQGPKEGQFSHFWHLVMQETPGDIGVIIMLTQHVEGHKEKCAQYYPVDMENPTMMLPAHEGGNGGEEESGPQDDGDPFLDSPTRSADTDSLGTDSEASPQSSGGVGDDGNSQQPEQSGSVTLLSVHYDPRIGCQVRKLKLTIDDNTKTIYHYFFSGWPDFAKPEAEDRKALLELTRVSKAMAADAPRVVHCSAGVGRTGTWIALDFLLQELDAGRLIESSPPSRSSTPPPDPHTTQTTNPSGTWGRSGPPKSTTPDPKDEEDLIWETVNTLREQRMMMVMNELQYQFIYEAMKEAFIEKYAEKETGPVVIEVSEPSPKMARKKSPEKSGGMYQGTRGEDTASDDVGGESEAETEVMGEERGERDVDMNESSDGEEDESAAHRERASGVEVDPYAAAAPETLCEGQKADAQGEVRDNELE